MKEQDYIHIMNRIRKDHIENAMLWEAPAQQSRRSIRKLSIGVGAIAAAIAVCVGIIGYTGSLAMLTANNDIETDSAVSESAESETASVAEITEPDGDLSAAKSSAETETVPETNAAGINVFGGTGRLRSFRYYDLSSMRFGHQIAEDDEYIYDAAKGLRARKTGADTAFEAYDFPEIPDYDPASAHLFVTGGLCFLQKGFTMYAVNPGEDVAETVEIFTPSFDDIEYSVASLEYNVFMGFDPDADGKPTKLFLCGLAEQADDPDFYHGFNYIADLQTGECRRLTSGGDNVNWFVTDSAVYAFTSYFGDEKLYLTQFNPDGSQLTEDVSDWHILNDLWIYIGTDQCFFFENDQQQLCSAHFGDETPDVLSESYTDAVDRINIGDTDRVIGSQLRPACITLGDDRGSEDEILQQGDRAETFRYDLYGIYEEDEAVRICAFAADNNGKEYALVFVTKDGSNVTSYSIPFPQDYA